MISQLPTSTSETELVAQAQQRLESSPYAELRLIECRVDGGVLKLCGSVPRYYLKQHAYRVVADLKGVRHVQNEIVVRQQAESAHQAIAGVA